MRTLITIIVFLLLTPVYAQKLGSEKKAGLKEAEALTPQVEEVCQKLWDFSETALLEKQSAEYLANILEEEGFTLE